MIRRISYIFFVGLLILTTVSMVAAQDSIGIGDTVDGEASDSYAEYEIELEEGQTIEIEIDARWDTYLELYNDDQDSVAYDDDGGDGLQSRLVYTVEDSGTYFIRVFACCSQDNPPSDDYELSVEELEVIAVVDGGLLEYDDDEDVDADDAMSVEVTFEGEEGDVINVVTVSDDYLNTTMTIFNEQGEDIAESENYYGDALIQRLELEESGTFTVRIEDSQGSILSGDIEIEVQLSELFTLDDGEITIEIGDGEDITFIEFTVVEDVDYLITFTLDDEPDQYNEFSAFVLEEGEDPSAYSEINVRMTGGLGTAIMFEADDDGVFLVRLEYYNGDDLEVTIDIEAVNE